MKKIFMTAAVIAGLIMCNAVYADSFTAVRHADTGNVYVKGQIDDITSGDVTITAISNGNLVYAEQTAPDNNGEFVSKFKYAGSLDDIKVHYNGKSISGTTSETNENKLSGEACIEDEYGTAFISVQGSTSLTEYTHSRTINGTEYTHKYTSEYSALPVISPTAKITVKNVYGDYGSKVKVMLAAYDADGRMLMVKTADKAVKYGHEGEKYEKSFELNEALPQNTALLKAFAWDSDNNFVPLCEYAVNELKPINLYAVGDSTCQPYIDSYYPQSGWGTYIGDYFKTGYVNVINCGHGGATTTSFLDGSNGNWNTEVYNCLKPGDYVLISLGINDSFRVTANKYGQNLQRMIDDVREKGAEVIISTPIRETSTIETSNKMKEILDTAKQVAEDNDVPFLNIYDRAEKENPDIESLQTKYSMHRDTLSASAANGGFELSTEELNNHGNQDIQKGDNDHMHVNIRGANYYARLMTLELLESNSELCKYVRYTE